MPSEPRVRQVVALAALIAFAGVESGCSWIFVKKEPPLPLEPTPPVECTTSRAAPIIDVVTGSVFAAGAIVSGLALAPCVVETCDEWSQFWAIAGVALGALAVGATAIISGAYGFKHTKECEKLKSLQAACVVGDQDSCTLLRGEQPAPKEQPGPLDIESWLRDAASPSLARLSLPQEQSH